MKKLMMTLSLALMSTGAIAEQFTVKTVELSHSKSFHSESTGGAGGGGSRVNDIKEVIAVGRDLVAFGKEIYELVKRGKSVSVTEFTPISVVPKDAQTREPVEPLEMEGCSFPVEKKYLTTVTSAGREAARFEYLVVLIHSCSYNGKGKFIQRAIVQPISAKVAYNVEFNALLKVTGIMNHGSKDAPIAGAMLTLQLKVNTLTQAFEKNDTIYLSGKGEIKNYSY